MGSIRLAAILLFAALAPAQRLWIVNKAGGPGVDFTDIPPAIAAAAPGDTVRVTGVAAYSAFVVNKTLAVEAPDGTTCVGGGAAITVTGIPSGSTARVAGFTPSIIGFEVHVMHCSGNVILQRFSASPPPAVMAFQLTVTNSSAVLCTDSQFEGTFVPFALPTPAISVTQSGLVLQRCTVNGRVGTPYRLRTDGGDALFASGATLLCVDSKITGGSGANGDLSISPCGTNGGVGIYASAGSTAVVLGISTVSGGAPGTNLQTSCANTIQGNAATGNVAIASEGTVSGSLANGAARVRSLAWIESPGKASLGAPVTITLRGASGTTLGLHLDAAFGVTSIPGFDTPYLGSIGALPVALVTLDATGALPLTFVVPNNPVLSNLMVYFHAIAGEPTTNLVSFTNLGDLLLR